MGRIKILDFNRENYGIVETYIKTKELAQAEVNLVWAAAEYRELGWHHSREIFASAERLMDQATYLSENRGTL